MNLFYIFFVSTFVLCESDPGYNLMIGNSIDLFGNYGHLCNETQVISDSYTTDEPVEIFKEKNIPVFTNASSTDQFVDSIPRLTVLLSDTIEDLLNTYFQDFSIEGTEQSWKAFMGDWKIEDIMNALGITYEYEEENCCYALVKVAKTHRTATMDTSIQNLAPKTFVSRAIERLNISNPIEVRRFIASYGTHYIDSYSTGNFIYQVFKYKENGYKRLRRYLRNSQHINQTSLRYYFSSFFLKEIGDIRIASGNKDIEDWARKSLRDVQYLYSRPSLLRINSPVLSAQLGDLLDDSALLSLNLKTTEPLFKDRHKRKLFKEILENDLLLWENNYFLVQN